MSNKSARKVKLDAKPKTPRSMAEIEAEYRNAILQAGQLQYQAEVYGKELAQLNAHIERLNHEGAARKELDAKSPPAPAAPASPAEAVTNG